MGKIEVEVLLSRNELVAAAYHELCAEVEKALPRIDAKRWIIEGTYGTAVLCIKKKRKDTHRAVINLGANIDPESPEVGFLMDRRGKFWRKTLTPTVDNRPHWRIELAAQSLSTLTNLKERVARAGL